MLIHLGIDEKSGKGKQDGRAQDGHSRRVRENLTSWRIRPIGYKVPIFHCPPFFPPSFWGHEIEPSFGVIESFHDMAKAALNFKSRRILGRRTWYGQNLILSASLRSRYSAWKTPYVDG